jgi:hypothetical protein
LLGNSEASNQPRLYPHEVNLQDGTTFSNWGNLKSYKLTCGGGGIDANSQSVSNVGNVIGSSNTLTRIKMDTDDIDIRTNDAGDIRFGLQAWINGGWGPKIICSDTGRGTLDMGKPQMGNTYKNAIINVVDISGSDAPNNTPLTVKNFGGKPIVVTTHTFSPPEQVQIDQTGENVIIRSNAGSGIDIGAGFSTNSSSTFAPADPGEVLIRTGQGGNQQSPAPKRYSFRNTVFDVCGNNITGVDNLDVSSINQSPATTTLSIGNVTGPSQTTFKGRANFETPATLMYDSSINIASAMTTNGDIAIASNTNLGKGSIMYRSNNINRVLFPGEVYFKLGVEMVSGSSGYDVQTNGGTPTSPFSHKKMLPLDTLVFPNISNAAWLRNDTPYVLNIEGISIELGPYQCWTTQGNTGNTFDAAINFQIWIYGGVDGQTPWGSGNPTPSPQRIQQSNSGGYLYQDVLVSVRGVGGGGGISSGVSADTATYKRCFAEANPATNSSTIFASCNSATYRHEFVETPVAVTTGLPGGGTANSQGTYWYPGTRLYIKNNNICNAVTNWTGTGTVNLSNVKSRYRVTSNNVGGGLWGANIATIRARPVGLA